MGNKAPLFNILKFECADPAGLGFSATYSFDKVKERVKFVRSIDEAIKLRNRGVLVSIEGYPMSLELVRGFEGKKSMLLLDLGAIINSSGGKRASMIKRMRNFAGLCIRHKVPFAMASFCDRPESARNAQELVHIGFLIGLDRGQGREALSRLNEILGNEDG